MAKLLSRKTDLKEGAPAPLFLRLIDDQPHIKSEQHVKNFLTPDELEISIADELEIILNTRLSAAADEGDPQRNSDVYLLPDFFGLRDFSAFDLESALGRSRILQKIRDVILRFEPRLLSPSVNMTGLAEDKTSLNVEIKGEVLINAYRRQVTFPMTIHNLLQRK